MLTPEQYVERNGDCCPVCLSEGIEGYGVEIEGSTASQVVSCHKCQANWIDRYKLLGYFNLER